MWLLYYGWGLFAGAAGAPPPTFFTPSYPTWLPRLRPRHLFPWNGVTPTLPIPNPAPPAQLSWQGWQPAQHPPRIVVPRLGAIAAPISTLPVLVPTLGRAIYPSQFWPTRRPLVPFVVAPVSSSAIAGNVNIGSWRPRYPDQLWPRPAVRLGQTVLVTVPTTTVISAICVEITDEDLTGPDLTGEAVADPTLTGETLTSPTLTGEDLC